LKKIWKEIDIEHNKLTEWNWMVQYPETLKMGDRVSIGPFTLIQARYGVVIGDHVQISSHCSIYSHNTIDDTKGKVIIGDYACIGSHTVIFPGVTIGERAVVGAHSLVKSDIPAGAMAFGVSAKVRNRSNREDSEKG